MASALNYFIAIVIVISIAALIGCLITLLNDKWFGPLARRLRHRPIDPVVSSPLTRGLSRLEEIPLECAPASANVTIWHKWNLYARKAGVSLRFVTIVTILEMTVLVMGCLYSQMPIRIALLIAVIPPIPNTLWIISRHRRRLHSVEAQIPAALNLICSAMRAGQSLAGALLAAGESIPGPLAVELGSLSQALNLGVSLEDALDDFTSRVASDHISYVAAAIRMQHRLGGDLTKLLDKVSETVRQRFEVMNQIQALSAEGRLSGSVLMLMPLSAFGMMFYLAPEYVAILYQDPMGQKLLGATIVLQLVGIITIRKICTATA